MLNKLNDKRFNDLIQLEFLSSSSEKEDKINITFPLNTIIPESFAVGEIYIDSLILVKKGIHINLRYPTTFKLPVWYSGSKTLKFKLSLKQYGYFKLLYI